MRTLIAFFARLLRPLADAILQSDLENQRRENDRLAHEIQLLTMDVERLDAIVKRDRQRVEAEAAIETRRLTEALNLQAQRYPQRHQ